MEQTKKEKAFDLIMSINKKQQEQESLQRQLQELIKTLNKK